ncbi:MAG: gamma-butyrobetaine hydroxylase-like domain-containing protein [Chloroflexota bacterium]
MNAVKPRPVDITLNKKEGYLQITWNIDNRVCRYPLPQLREACPCVECRGGHQYMGAAFDPDNLMTIPLTPARSYEITDMELVGNYALQPIWSDGHHTGIYTWDFLWKLCPEDDAADA